MKILFIPFIAVFFSFSSCEKPPFAESFNSIVIKNKSQINLNFNFYDKANDFKYPDTTFPVYKPYMLSLKSNNSYEVTTMLKWEDYFKKLRMDTLSIYFFNSDTLNKYPWDSIRSNYMILQRYDLSLKDLQNRNFEIEYPYDSARGKLKVYRK